MIFYLFTGWYKKFEYSVNLLRFNTHLSRPFQVFSSKLLKLVICFHPVFRDKPQNYFPQLRLLRYKVMNGLVRIHHCGRQYPSRRLSRSDLPPPFPSCQRTDLQVVIDFRWLASPAAFRRRAETKHHRYGLESAGAVGINKFPTFFLPPSEGGGRGVILIFALRGTSGDSKFMVLPKFYVQLRAGKSLNEWICQKF